MIFVKNKHIYTCDFENLCRKIDEPRVARCGQCPICIYNSLNMHVIYVCM